MDHTEQLARAAITSHQQEIAHLLLQPTVDHLAIEELLAACQRENRKIRSAQHIASAAPRQHPGPLHLGHLLHHATTSAPAGRSGGKAAPLRRHRRAMRNKKIVRLRPRPHLRPAA